MVQVDPAVMQPFLSALTQGQYPADAARLGQRVDRRLPPGQIAVVLLQRLGEVAVRSRLTALAGQLLEEQLVQRHAVVLESKTTVVTVERERCGAGRRLW